ncbi:glyceraldehyde-3-phosphate dehydrogenase [Tenacibaculum maritimum]|uniref:Glyceraldehyde 3-phosphate dehydrogenase n=1 Tax=Tenacibaculum maritimum NCIMB 2154 TaxID=1349785 RepID=A0A2H1EA80_9FLAO|nr:glyceraldehyde-3-phosphate dehydrogenase [Tenacibaculum maritimum]MCD9561797.1 glyceraldehyde-3-phosphate dehydrogenase [Tenacibaculum maritimum]MCD9565233.1 glyceraldehyde-3-phosphate dehydrogenase [Tenacibaculum maritimum]MCD9578633.1 glyceraldehyde-3-phosphate dehydrogenase [Tenacibaculum maritimum]MCD9581025.1 glyceraldehyde-3-phosphate dehydrogenase [Tenacibaculum maritimum]MCD9585229.1 glyceraldehyde-3-phosphate dehydrogenase [Tenacibaculum maritimum]
MSTITDYEKEVTVQAQTRRATVEFINIVNDLWYDKSIELVLFRNPLVDKRASEVLNLINYAKEFVAKPISIDDALEIAKAIQSIALPPSKLDIGKLAYESHLNEDKNEDKVAFVTQKLQGATEATEIAPKDVVLYGFGRIGRLLARELMSKMGKGSQLRLRAIVTRGEINQTVLEKRASLLSIDSVHGDFLGTVEIDADNNALIINGTTVHMISASKPEDIDYTEYGIQDALIIDNTGAFRDKEALSRHLVPNGASKVLLTAPGKGIPNIVHGVNQGENNPDEIDIFSAASCTTNAITPVLKVLEDNYGIKKGHLETIHAYTNDQNLVDNMHKKYRRGRAAALNMVITETGAGKAVAKALPALEGKLTSSAIRVPVPNGSLAILNLQLHSEVTVDAINAIMKKYALEGELVEQIKYSMDHELVSSDIVGTTAPSIFDSKATIADGDTIVIYIWYDNEYGYSHQVMRLAKHIAKVRRYTYY